MNLAILLTPFLCLFISQRSWAETANCTINISDVKKGTDYKVESKFNFVKGGKGQWKHFETPGNEYNCNLAFYDMNSGTMISCGFKKDNGETFFQSDRTSLKETPTANHLSFRHGSAFISLKATCD